MKTSRKVGVFMILLGLGGLALLVYLLARHGFADIAGAIAAAGWGLLAVIACHGVVLLCDALSWRVVIPPEQRPRFWVLYQLRWIGEAVSSMLPVAQVGGEVVRVRLAAGRGLATSVAAATVLIRMTVCVATQVLFALSGLVVLLLSTGRQTEEGITRSVIISAIIGALAIAGFYAVQRIGLFRLIAGLIVRIASNDAWASLVQRGAALDADVRALYARRWALVGCLLWNMAGCAVAALEVWIALWALGAPANYAHAFVLEGMSQGIRSTMFLVPGALGVQESGYLIVGGLLGIPPEAALALALVKRVRELAIGIPGVLAWQWIEGKQLRSSSSEARTSESPSSTAAPKAP